MGLFGNLTGEGLEETQDRIGGYQPLDTDIYHGKIKYAYAGKSSGGASSVTMAVDFGGKEYRETFWVTNRQGVNSYDVKDRDGIPTGRKQGLPGFVTVDDICLIATGSPLSEQDAEDKVINVYDSEQKKELPKAVPMLTGLIGQDIALAIVKATENRTEKQGDEYVEIADTRDVNFVDKVFHPEKKMTVFEARNGADATFYDKWKEKNKGVTQDRRKLKDGEAGKSGKPGSAPTSGTSSTPARKSLFGGN